MHHLYRSEVARRARINGETLRYYEKCDLLPEPGRSPAGYRLYDEAVLERLEFIALAKSGGFTLKEIGGLLALGSGRGKPLAAALRLIDRKIAELEAGMRRTRESVELLRQARRSLTVSPGCPVEHLKKRSKRGLTR